MMIFVDNYTLSGKQSEPGAILTWMEEVNSLEQLDSLLQRYPNSTLSSFAPNPNWWLLTIGKAPEIVG